MVIVCQYCLHPTAVKPSPNLDANVSYARSVRPSLVRTPTLYKMPHKEPLQKLCCYAKFIFLINITSFSRGSLIRQSLSGITSQESILYYLFNLFLRLTRMEYLQLNIIQTTNHQIE